MIQTIIVGNLTRDPETRTTPKGDAVCTFTVAADRRFPVNGEKVTDFYRVTAWRQLGETCSKFLTKGRKVLVFGEPHPRLYNTNDGETRLSLDLEADRIEFLSGRNDSDSAPVSAPASAPASAAQPSAEEDDLPF